MNPAATMYPRFRSLILHWLKVPPEPHPPAGDPASLRVFRAGKHDLTLRLLGWAGPQALALAGIIFWTVMLVQVEDAVRTQRAARALPPPPSAPSPTAGASPVTTPPTPPTGKAPRQKVRVGSWAEFRAVLVHLALLLPWWGFPLLGLFKIGGILLYLVQIPLTYAIRRLDYEMRWYVVTDRSLRIRTGVWRVQELTMSFANLQQVTVSQNPVQRLLGLADVRVQTAGGGGDAHEGKQTSLHLAEFHGVDNAAEIRDLILDRLRRFRAAGLGDPEDHRHDQTVSPGPPAPAHPPAASAEALAAARTLLAEARALRRALVK